MKSTIDIVNDSGYPLQLHLEELINNTSITHKWRVLAREHRWVNKETLEEGYIDLILENADIDLRLVIECKRISGTWTFLIPTPKYDQLMSKTRVFQVNYNLEQYFWHNMDIKPDTYISSFCVPEVEGKKDNRTIEKIAGELLLSLESIAYEERKINPPFRHLSERTSNERNLFYLPIIITTAKLNCCKFNPMQVTIKDGKIPSNSQVDNLPYVRLCKNLATSVIAKKTEDINSLREVNQENDRTIFIVQSENIIEFLSSIANY